MHDVLQIAQYYGRGNVTHPISRDRLFWLVPPATSHSFELPVVPLEALFLETIDIIAESGPQDHHFPDHNLKHDPP